MSQKFKVNIKEVYDRAAVDYDEHRMPWVRGHLAFIERETFRKIVKDGSILEVGCGTGRVAQYFTDREYFGIDISREMIKHAKDKYRRYCNIHFIISDAEMMCFRNGLFENIIAAKAFISFLIHISF